MKISIITVCYNSQSTIEDTIKSVKSQTYKDIEYIIVDGNSKDSTMDVVKRFPDVVTKFISEPDRGLYDAMNKGINLATGDVIGILNSDDLFCDETAIQQVMAIFEKENLDSVYADIYYVQQGNTDKIVRTWKTGRKRDFKSGWHPAHPTFYVKRHVYKNYGSFDLNFRLAADFEIMLRFLEKYKISTAYLEKPLIKMRLGGETNKSIKNILKQNLECIKAFRSNDLPINGFLYPISRILPKLLQFRKN